MSDALRRVSPVKPMLRGARNWGTAKLRAASYTREGFRNLVLSIVAGLAVLVFLGLWMAGLLGAVGEGAHNAKRRALMGLGFTIETVDVIGEGRMDEAGIRRALEAWPGDYFFGFDARAAQRRVEGLPWVERAVVRRLRPDRIVVQVVEHSPAALWQSGGELAVVDASGSVVAVGGGAAARAPGTLHIVGEGAPEHADVLRAHLSSYSLVADRLEVATRVGDRWDLRLGGGVQVMLAEDTAASLERLAGLHGRTGILDRTVARIDLRLSDRIGVTPTPATPRLDTAS